MNYPPNFVPLESLARSRSKPEAANPQRTSFASNKPNGSFKAIELEPKNDFVLTALEIGLSSNCNFRCDYCCAYNLNDRKFLTAESIFAILDDAPALKRVKLSGGEVLIYFDECVKVVEYCSSRGIQTQINTNGSLLNEEKIRTLEEAGLGCLHYSFNFTNSKDFSAYYKQPGTVFDKILQNIRISTRSSIDTVLESVIFKRTEFTLTEIHHFIHDLGVRKHEIQNGIPIEKNDWAEVLPRERLEAVIDRLIENRHPDITLFFSCIDIEPNSDFYQKVLSFIARGSIHFPSCIEGRNQLHVHSNGDVLICELGHPKVIANLKEGTRLNDLLTNKPPALVDFLERRNADACSCVIRTLVQPN
jgi:MoaA/NifB/PqqE/SkfB family radical SAM enzyme